MTIKTAWDARQKAEKTQENANIDYYLGYIDGLCDKGDTDWEIFDYDEKYPNAYQVVALQKCGFDVKAYNSHGDINSYIISWKNTKNPEETTNF